MFNFFGFFSDKLLVEKIDYFNGGIIFLGSFLGTYVGFAMWIIGMAKTTASIASILNQTSTIFIAFFGWLILKEKFSNKMLLCFLIALLGAFIIISNP